MAAILLIFLGSGGSSGVAAVFGATAAGIGTLLILGVTRYQRNANLRGSLVFPALGAGLAILKLPVLVLGARQSVVFGPDGPTFFAIGIGLVYSALVGWLILSRLRP